MVRRYRSQPNQRPGAASGPPPDIQNAPRPMNVPASAASPHSYTVFPEAAERFFSKPPSPPLQRFSRVRREPINAVLSFPNPLPGNTHIENTHIGNTHGITQGFQDGSSFQGTYRNRLPDSGIQRFTDGSSFQGEYQGGLPSSGILNLADGSSFEGKFRRGLPSYGALTSSEGRRFSGHFKDGLPHDRQGAIKWPSGELYVGHVKAGVREGKGSMFARDGIPSSYEGDWHQDMPHGFGVLRMKDGNGEPAGLIGRWRNGTHRIHDLRPLTLGERMQEFRNFFRR